MSVVWKPLPPVLTENDIWRKDKLFDTLPTCTRLFHMNAPMMTMTGQWWSDGNVGQQIWQIGTWNVLTEACFQWWQYGSKHGDIIQTWKSWYCKFLSEAWFQWMWRQYGSNYGDKYEHENLVIAKFYLKFDFNGCAHWNIMYMPNFFLMRLNKMLMYVF